MGPEEIFGTAQILMPANDWQLWHHVKGQMSGPLTGSEKVYGKKEMENML